MKSNKEYRNEGANSLNGNWWTAALMMLVYFLINCAFEFNGKETYYGMYAAGLILIVCPMSYGMVTSFLTVVRGNKLKFSQLFAGFKDYGRVLGTMLLVGVYTLLWALLLIVPGIVKSYSYALTPYILVDHPELANNAAIEKSMAMMRGHKMKLFLLDLSFIGWWFLCLLTLGIGLLFLTPYVYASRAAFYEDLKAELERTADEGQPTYATV